MIKTVLIIGLDLGLENFSVTDQSYIIPMPKRIVRYVEAS